MLNLDKLEKAITSLETAFNFYHSGTFALGSQQKNLLRDGVIQRFAYTFELSWKTLKRYLEIYGLEKVDNFTNKELFRVGYEMGLLDDAAAWMGYLKRRNLTSHVYEDEIAKKVYAAVEDFLRDAEFLLQKLKASLK